MTILIFSNLFLENLNLVYVMCKFPNMTFIVIFQKIFWKIYFF